jgi:hypothetical protein
MAHKGGCQCGSVRYTIAELGRATICHCRMCQKAFGSFFGPLVTAKGFTLTRGLPAIWSSSNKVKRGFCGLCGTPLSYDWGGDIEIAIGSLDEPEDAAPLLQVNVADKLSYFSDLHRLPVRQESSDSPASIFMDDIENYQHPDYDTDL